VGTEPEVDIIAAGPGFFGTLGVRVIDGRPFEESDRFGGRPVVVISEGAAREFWPGEDPIGKTIGLAKGGGFREGAAVVGVVGDVHYQSVEDAPRPTAYAPMSQLARSGGYVFVRTARDPRDLAASVRGAVRSMDPNILVSSVRTMDEMVADVTV
jgi:putative ABC transport system permease protein